MAYWFQRNCLKATTEMTFETSMISHEFEALKICNDLKGARARLLDLLPNANHDLDTLEIAYKSYMSLLSGFIYDIEHSAQASKLRNNFLFKWTHTLLGNTPELCQDTAFEAANITCNLAIWFMKHASMIAGKDEVNMDEAKEAHTCLRKAAGAFTFVKDTLMPMIVDKQKDGGDLDKRVLTAYIKQCTAEAQEVTVARAIELKHNPSLISALATETSTLFRDGAIAIQSIPQANQWNIYFQLKEAFYKASAYNYLAENLLTLDRCGEAISALRQSQKEQLKTEEICKDYAKVKGPGRSAKPEKHPFFRRLAPLVKFTLDKCERENGFIYHQRVPNDPPELEVKATYGLVSPEAFSLPNLSPLWTPVTYAAFQPKLASAKDPANSHAAAKVAGDLPPVKEVKIHQTSNEHANNSGCTIQ